MHACVRCVVLLMEVDVCSPCVCNACFCTTGKKCSFGMTISDLMPGKQTLCLVPSQPRWCAAWRTIGGKRCLRSPSQSQSALPRTSTVTKGGASSRCWPSRVCGSGRPSTRIIQCSSPTREKGTLVALLLGPHQAIQYYSSCAATAA